MWAAAAGCVSSTKTGKAPAKDVVQPVDAAVDTLVDTHMADSGADLGPEPDIAPPEDTSPPTDTFVPPPQDTTPPIRPEGGSLLASVLRPTSLTLSRPFTTDDTAVVAYKVVHDDVQLAILTALQTSISVSALPLGFPLNFSVTATDTAGNTSAPLTLTVAPNDTHAPTWNDHARFLISQSWDTGAFFAWTGAEDNVQVAEYRIMDGETVLRTITGSIETSFGSEITTASSITVRC
jgi:hypothetical protein